MAEIEEVNIDVRDVDYSWFECVKAYLDRDFDRYYLPHESIDRLGELDETNGNAWLIDGQVEAEADHLEFGGATIPVWTVGCAQLIVRPASSRVRRDDASRFRG